VPLDNRITDVLRTTLKTARKALQIRRSPGRVLRSGFPALRCRAPLRRPRRLGPRLCYHRFPGPSVPAPLRLPSGIDVDAVRAGFPALRCPAPLRPQHRRDDRLRPSPVSRPFGAGLHCGIAISPMDFPPVSGLPALRCRAPLRLPYDGQQVGTLAWFPGPSVPGSIAARHTGRGAGSGRRFPGPSVPGSIAASPDAGAAPMAPPTVGPSPVSVSKVLLPESITPGRSAEGTGN